MTIIAISGTPGTGKTALSESLRLKGYSVLDINEHIRTHGILGERDEERDTFEVDIDALNRSISDVVSNDGVLFIDSHMSHCLDCDVILVLRCSPNVLSERLRRRGYSENKIRENIQAEILDVILCEAADSDVPVYEFNTSDGDVEMIVENVEYILAGNTDKYLPGDVDWTGEIETWF
jgi:Predicted nucleotide kinase (related to CMP and AMP kinases)